MKTWIEKIRSKPHHKRNQIIWICAGIAVAVLLIIWMVVGNPGQPRDGGTFFQTFNQDLEQSKDILPDLPNQ